MERREPAADDPVRLFWRRLIEATPRAWVTPVIAAACVAYFALYVSQGVDAFDPSASSLIEWGGNFPMWTRSGDYWRLFTSMFMHAGVVHIAINMWVFWDGGRLVERLYGNVGFAILYLYAGLGGSIASAFFGSVVSVGASGAIFGVFGALLAYLVARRRTIPAPVLRGLRSSVLTFIGFNLLIGFVIPFVDNAAHIGGLVTGFVCGFVLALPLTPEARKKRMLRNAVLLAVGGAALVAAMFAIGALPPASAPQTEGSGQTAARGDRVEVREQLVLPDADRLAVDHQIAERALGSFP